MPYNILTEAGISELTRICGAENVYRDSVSLSRYAHDQVPEKKYAHAPEVVLRPQNSDQIRAILRFAHQRCIPVTPRGAGSGLSGGAVPLYGGICLTLESMNRILEIDPKNQIAVVEPGLVTNHLDRALADQGLFFAGYPLSEEICSIGGNVAENAGGGRAIKYGVTSRYITGLEIVLADGEILRLGGKRIKDVTGYDLLHLMIGSEGTLGVFTKIFVKLLPRPKFRMTVCALFPDPDTALAVLPRLLSSGDFSPSAVEFVDRFSLQHTCVLLGETLPYQQAGALLLIEVDGNDKQRLKKESRLIQTICQNGQADTVLAGDSEAESARFWKLRKQIPWALKQISSYQSVEDISLPVAELPVIIKKLKDLEQTYQVQIPAFGHAGDGNLHATPIKQDQSVEEWEQLIPNLLADLYRLTTSLGGTISGEHGIGHKRKPYLPLVLEPIHLDLLKRVKQTLDPKGILNPGKIVDL